MFWRAFTITLGIVLALAIGYVAWFGFIAGLAFYAFTTFWK
jgi:hypothetical protein